MRRVTTRVLAATAMLCALPASAEPRASHAPSTVPAGDEERAFEVEAARYERFAAFTQKLVREREQRAFDEAAERYRRLVVLTHKLAEAAAAALEREFDAEVELYLRKAELTRELAARSSARAAGTAPAPSVVPSSSAPVW